MAPAFADDERPTGVDDTETALFEGEAVVFREATSAIHRLNAAAAAVWVCCDGDTTVGVMIDDLAEAFAAPVDQVRPIVLEALTQLAELGLLASHPTGPQVKVTAVDEQASDGSRIIACPPDT